MKFLFDLFPIILFFGIFKWGESHQQAAQAFASDYFSGLVSGGNINGTLAPVLLATAVAIAATACQIIYLLIRRKKIDGMLWLSLGIISVFGGATIYFQNDTFIKWKPTILYWCFAVALCSSQLFLKKNLIRSMMEKQISMPDKVWQQLNTTWIAFFSAMGLLNLYVAFSYSFSAWVSFKLFGFTGIMLAFIVAQSLFLAKHMKEPQ